MPSSKKNRLSPSTSIDMQLAFSELLSGSRLLAVIMNLRAELLYCNEFFLTATGWDWAELQGRMWQEVLAPPGIGDLRQMLDDLLDERPGSWHEENEIVTRQGGSLFVRWNYILMRDESGIVVAAACIGEDVTERVLLQRTIMAESRDTLLSLQQELHDGLAQELFGLSMTAKSLATFVEKGGAVTEGQLVELAELANAAMDTCRRVSRSAVTVSETSGDLVGALQRLMVEPPHWQGPHLIFSGTVLNSVQLSAAACEHIYKIFREALTNALKHARATSVTLRLNVRSTRLIVELSDDGVGFNPETVTNGLGVRLMRQRAGLLHAIFRVQSRPKMGVTVRLRCTVASNRP